jgi:large subunit ribosomal protein L24
MAAKIKKGDQVIVIAGKDKGRTGEVKACLSNSRLVVSNVGIVKKHLKANPDRGVQGGIVEKELPIHISNVALIDKLSGKPSKVGFKTLENGQKVRYLKSSNEVIDTK